LAIVISRKGRLLISGLFFAMLKKESFLEASMMKQIAEKYIRQALEMGATDAVFF
jgi:hypothetical protein